MDIKKFKEFDKRGNRYSRESIECFLLPIIKNKVITEKDLIKKFSNHKIGISKISMFYKQFVSLGFPLRRKEVAIGSISAGRKGTIKPNFKNRAIIYYIE